MAALSRASELLNSGTAPIFKSTATLQSGADANRSQFSTYCSALQADRFFVSSSRCLPHFKAAQASSKRGAGGGRRTTASMPGSRSRASESLESG